MKNFIIRRVLYAVPITFGVMVITFLLFRIVGGDLSRELAGKMATPELIAEIRHEYGWDKPLFFNFSALREGQIRDFFDTQFFDHLKNCITFNFGKSIRYKEPVLDMIKDGAGPSLSITVPMFIIGLITSLSISLVVAYVRGTLIDKGLVVFTVLLMSFPYLSFILVGQYFLAYKWGLFPVFGYESGLGAIKYVTLPVIIGVISGLGGSVRFYRTVILDEIHADYVRTARAKGASRTRVLFKHVLKNAMIPVITQVVLAIPFLFLGSLLLERFFGIPGLGYLTVESINARDYPVISAMTYIGALLYIAGLIVTDLCYALVDPRVELQ
jgi:peptide/nickel transport system permease protein